MTHRLSARAPLIRMRGLAGAAFGLPSPAAPGLAACAICLIRIPLFALAAVLGMWLLNLLVHAFDPSAPDAIDAFGPFAVLCLLALSLELHRWSFARAAVDPARALQLFCAMTSLSIGALLLAARASPPILAGCVIAEPIAGGLLYLGLPYRREAASLVLGLTCAHAALFTLPLLLGSP